MIDPISAVTHPDPYPYYAQLPPFYRDETIGMWVASGDAVARVLTDPAMRVRPPSEQLPEALRGFARLSDGAVHEEARAEIVALIEKLGRRDCRPYTEDDPTKFVFNYPLRFLGIDVDPAVVADYARCIFSGEVPSQIAHGLTRAQLSVFTQTYGATAGLISATLIALARSPNVSVSETIDHVLRFDPPVHNTRRYRADTGEAVLVILVNAPFGAGAHGCPGRELATKIAHAAVTQLLADGFDPTRLNPHPTFRPSANLRIPNLELIR